MTEIKDKERKKIKGLKSILFAKKEEEKVTYLIMLQNKQTNR